jgi:hypothetical protein
VNILASLRSRRNEVNHSCNRFPDLRIKFPVYVPVNSLFRFTRNDVVLSWNLQFREQESGFWGQNFTNSLLFSLLAGNLAGERLALDCALRQQVLTAENSRRLFPRNTRKMPIFRDSSSANRTAQNGLLNSEGGRCPHFSLDGKYAVRFQGTDKARRERIVCTGRLHSRIGGPYFPRPMASAISRSSAGSGSTAIRFNYTRSRRVRPELCHSTAGPSSYTGGCRLSIYHQSERPVLSTSHWASTS